jgi:transcription termination factor Rho
MVAAIENWSDLVGRVRHISNHDPGTDFTTIAVDVEQVDDVKGFPNLLADVNHTTVHIAVRDDRLRRLRLKTGDRIRCRTRRARGNRLFAHPDSPEVVTE